MFARLVALNKKQYGEDKGTSLKHIIWKSSDIAKGRRSHIKPQKDLFILCANFHRMKQDRKSSIALKIFIQSTWLNKNGSAAEK